MLYILILSTYYYSLYISILTLGYNPDDVNQPVVNWNDFGFMIGEQVETSAGYDDLSLLYACRVSQQLRSRIFNELGYTCSTGIGHNKTLAKLISAFNKPNKQVHLIVTLDSFEGK